jgi:hypothetical protein
MTDNLLEAPERGEIEAILKKSSVDSPQAPTFEKLLGFLTGAVITPGHFMADDWLQPLFDLNGIVVIDIGDIELLMNALTSLYDRLNAMRLRKGRLCPFDLTSEDIVSVLPQVIDWAIGLNSALTFQEDMWIPYEDEVEYIDEKLKLEVNVNLQCLNTIADPASIPELIKDPLPFQRNVLAKCFEWREDMFKESWDQQLIDLYTLFCIGRLDMMMGTLLRYASAYDEGDVPNVADSSFKPEGE